MIGLENSVDRKKARVGEGGGAVSKKNVSAFGYQFGLKISG